MVTSCDPPAGIVPLVKLDVKTPEAAFGAVMPVTVRVALPLFLIVSVAENDEPT